MKWFQNLTQDLLTTGGGTKNTEGSRLSRESSTVRIIRSPAIRALDLVNKMGGKVVATGRVVVSPDGKTRTLHLSTTDSAGKKISSLGVYDKQ